jgi:hypothetical protein
MNFLKCTIRNLHMDTEEEDKRFSTGVMNQCTMRQIIMNIWRISYVIVEHKFRYCLWLQILFVFPKDAILQIISGEGCYSNNNQMSTFIASLNSYPFFQLVVWIRFSVDLSVLCVSL